jgi:hypothetical protein
MQGVRGAPGTAGYHLPARSDCRGGLKANTRRWRFEPRASTDKAPGVPRRRAALAIGEAVLELSLACW